MLKILHLNTYDGPNILSPSPGVRLIAQSDRDRAARMRAALKDGAQFVGLVIAHLEVAAHGATDGVLITATFDTAMPAIGAALCEYVVAGLLHEAHDDEWDRDGPLFDLQARRRQEALPVAALQLIAEARQRGLPTFVRADGYVQFGYGAGGWSFDPEPLRQRGVTPPVPPWEHLGTIRLVAVTGQQERAAVVQRLASRLEATGLHVLIHPNASFNEARHLLADQNAEALVLGLATGDLLRRGLPFDRCDIAAISDRAGTRPPEALNDDEWLRALGLPMLLSPQAAYLNLTDPGLHPLIPYAPNGVVELP